MADPAAPLWAKWHGSGPGSHPGPGMLASGYATDFAQWASAASETAFTVGSTTVINCWEMVLYAAYKAGQLTWAWIHDRYAAAGGTWSADMIAHLTPKGRTAFDRATQSPQPRRGDIVLFDGINHVALATGNGTHTYTFWPPPDVSVQFGVAGGAPTWWPRQTGSRTSRSRPLPALATIRRADISVWSSSGRRRGAKRRSA